MAVEVGQKYQGPSGNRWHVDYVGTKMAMVTCVARGESGWDVGDERSYSLDIFEDFRLVKEFFELGHKYKYKYNGSASTYKVQSLYQNGDQVFAVLFWSNPITGKGGITGEGRAGFELYEEIV